MTREETIKWLESLKAEIGKSEHRTLWHYAEAIDMAIEALHDRPTPCEKCIHVKSCRKVIILKNRTYKLIKYCSQGVERREPDKCE